MGLVNKYPQDFPLNEMRDLYSYIVGADDSVETNYAVQCGWVVLGYGLNAILPPDGMPGDTLSIGTRNEIGGLKDLAAELRVSMESTDASDAVKMTKFNWQKIVTLILKFLPLFFEDKESLRQRQR
jgi:hypothetical protein